MDDAFSHHIEDTNTLSIHNSEFSATATVQCASMEGRHAFSFYENGSPLHPDSAITIPKSESRKICKGDRILVYDDECVIISMSKEKLSESVKPKQTPDGGKPFVIYEHKRKLEGLMEEQQ